MEEKKKTMAETFLYEDVKINRDFVSKVVDVTMPDKFGASTVLFKDGSTCTAHWKTFFLANKPMAPMFRFDQHSIQGDLSMINLPLFKIILAYGTALPKKSALEAVDKDITDNDDLITLYTVSMACEAVDRYNKAHKNNPPQI